MKIIEHFININDGESKIILDLDGLSCILYVTKDGFQLNNKADKEFTFDEFNQITKFVQEYLDAISENKPILLNEQTQQTNA